MCGRASGGIVVPRPLIDRRLQAELTGLYGAAERHYHGLPHIEAMLRQADEYRYALSDPEAVRAAIWFHDAIYDTRAADNEARSAALARERLAHRADPDRLARIAAMIEATATHVVPDFEHRGAALDAALFLDMDLAILGASPAEFDRYEAAVRREFGWVSDTAWRKGRAAVLQGFLERPCIFHSGQFRKRLEAPARSNISRSLDVLRNPD
jgi:predicted metal-dependent HD superfamily phosphohydrolase